MSTTAYEKAAVIARKEMAYVQERVYKNNASEAPKDNGRDVRDARSAPAATRHAK